MHRVNFQKMPNFGIEIFSYFSKFDDFSRSGNYMNKGYIKGEFSEFEIQKNMNSIKNFNNVPFVKSNHFDRFF